MIQNNNNKSGGIGFMSLLGLLFIGLKLTGYITWSWWWVLAPFWGASGACRRHRGCRNHHGKQKLIGAKHELSA